MLYNNSQPAGYAAEPVETVNYAGCHDGEIIFDQLIMKPADQVHAGNGWAPRFPLVVARQRPLQTQPRAHSRRVLCGQL